MSGQLGATPLCKNDDIKTICTDLKLSLIERPYQQIVSRSGKELPLTYCELAAIFIGLVLRYIRNMFLDKQSQIYKNNYLRWQLNVGIPVKNYDAEEIKEVFYKATLAGWCLSEKRGVISLQSSREAFSKIYSKDFQPGIQRDFINVVPEVAAEVAGYAYSDLREEGLHLLVDIGATTLDVSTFLLNTKAGDNRYGFLSADIGRYGAFELHKARIESFNIFMNDWLTKARGISETLEPIPESCDHLIPKRTDILNLDTSFIEQAAVPITRVIAKTKKDRYPKAEEWSTGLPLFICGGGRMAKFYSDKLINHVKSTMNKSIIWNGFRIKEIPKPDNLEAEELRSHEYHRLAVAYGLSFQFDDIGIIVPPSEIDDVPPDRSNKNYIDKFISKDQV